MPQKEVVQPTKTTEAADQMMKSTTQTNIGEPENKTHAIPVVVIVEPSTPANPEVSQEKMDTEAPEQPQLIDAKDKTENKDGNKSMETDDREPDGNDKKIQAPNATDSPNNKAVSDATGVKEPQLQRAPLNNSPEISNATGQGMTAGQTMDTETATMPIQESGDGETKSEHHKRDSGSRDSGSGTPKEKENGDAKKPRMESPSDPLTTNSITEDENPKADDKPENKQESEDNSRPKSSSSNDEGAQPSLFSMDRRQTRSMANNATGDEQPVFGGGVKRENKDKKESKASSAKPPETDVKPKENAKTNPKDNANQTTPEVRYENIMYDVIRERESA